MINNVNSFLKIRDKWNAFIIGNSNNPFLLCEFVKGFMNLAFSKKWHPLIFVAFSSGEIVGMAPFVLKRRFNAFSAGFLYASHFSPDFLVKNEYRRSFLNRVFTLLFRYSGCKLLDLILPSSSPNVGVLKLICKENHMKFCSSSMVYLSHCVVPVERSWSDFEKIMGSNFRRYFKRIERKMMESGGYEVISVNKFDNSVLEDIFYVERRSWKEKWRRQKGINADGELIKILEGIKEIDSEFSTFKWNIWLLKINGELASYALTIQFKDVGYVVKTSFNEKFRNYYPGTYLVNAAVRGFFERTAVKIIDFQTNLPFMEKWKPIIYPRTRIMMGQGSLFSSIANISTNKVFCILRDQLVGPFIAKLPYLPLSL